MLIPPTSYSPGPSITSFAPSTFSKEILGLLSVKRIIWASTLSGTGSITIAVLLPFILILFSLISEISMIRTQNLKLKRQK